MSRTPLLLIPIAALLLAGCGQTGNLTLPDKKPAPGATTATRPVQPPATSQAPATTVTPSADPGHDSSGTTTTASPAPAEDQDAPTKKNGSSPQP
jgi:hypothetical protein